VKTCRFASDVGAKSPIKTRNGEMESFSVNSAKSYIGKNVNLHLKDGAVIVNVHLTRLHRGTGKNSKQIEYHLANRKRNRIPLKAVAYAQTLSNTLMKASA
jgi:hypothetical protein